MTNNKTPNNEGLVDNFKLEEMSDYCLNMFNRICMEASYEIYMSVRYTKGEQKKFKELQNAICKEINKRESK